MCCPWDHKKYVFSNSEECDFYGPSFYAMKMIFFFFKLLILNSYIMFLKYVLVQCSKFVHFDKLNILNKTFKGSICENSDAQEPLCKWEEMSFVEGPPALHEDFGHILWLFQVSKSIRVVLLFNLSLDLNEMTWKDGRKVSNTYLNHCWQSE